MAYDPDNVFARILRGELPAHRVLEDEHTLAFMDVMPQAVGHTLVVPKCAAENIFDVDPAVLAATMRNAQRVARAVRQVFAPPGLVIVQLSGAAAGQTVFHLHFHVIPRYEGAELRFRARGLADGAELAGQAERLRGAMG